MVFRYHVIAVALLMTFAAHGMQEEKNIETIIGQEQTAEKQHKEHTKKEKHQRLTTEDLRNTVEQPLAKIAVQNYQSLLQKQTDLTTQVKMCATKDDLKTVVYNPLASIADENYKDLIDEIKKCAAKDDLKHFVTEEELGVAVDLIKQNTQDIINKDGEVLRNALSKLPTKEELQNSIVTPINDVTKELFALQNTTQEKSFGDLQTALAKLMTEENLLKEIALIQKNFETVQKLIELLVTKKDIETLATQEFITKLFEDFAKKQEMIALQKDEKKEIKEEKKEESKKEIKIETDDKNKSHELIVLTENKKNEENEKKKEITKESKGTGFDVVSHEAKKLYTMKGFLRALPIVVIFVVIPFLTKIRR